MIRKITAPLYAKVADKDPVTKMQYLDLHLWLVHDILMKGDKMGMANSIEVRVPFLDREVLDFALGLPLDKKVQPPRTKIALREAADRRIRRETAEKKKLGFPIPMREWIREEPYYSRIREAFTSEAASRYFCTEKLVEMLEKHREGKRRDATDDSRKIWTVFIFLVWYERFFSTTNQEA